MELKYTRTGDYKLPNLTLNDNKKGTINKYGMLRLDYLMNYLKEKNGTTKAYRFKNKVLKMKTIASNSLCFVCFDSFQVQNLVQVIEMIQYHKSEINKIKKQSEGKHHYKCIIACETKLCKIIYKLCSSNCLYENK